MPFNEIESPDTTVCSHWRPASGIARFDIYRIDSHCVYLVPTAPVEPTTWWLALDGQPISEDFEMIGEVIIKDDELKYGAPDRDKLLVVTMPLDQPLTFEDPPMEFDFRMVEHALTTRDVTLCAQISNDELEKLCRGELQATAP